MGRDEDRDLESRSRADGSDPPGAFGRMAAAAARKLGIVVSAALAAVICAALLVNYVVMPLIARRGDHVAAPELVGLSLFEARREATEAGFQIRVDAERPDPQYRAGDVILQTPAAGLDVKRGRTLVLVVSAGIDRRTVPTLTGLPARQAQIDAELAGFAVSEIIQVHADAVERGRVIGSDPSDGALTRAGSTIRMLVSLGPRTPELIMPSLVGRTPEEARLVAEQLGLTVRSIKYERSRGFLRDIVVVQDPVAGSRVVTGEGVTLRVGKG